MNSEGNTHGKPKDDLSLVWRGVYFAPSAENIKSQVKEKAKLEIQKRIQQENTMNMYAIFGSGKSKETIGKGKAKLTHVLSDKDSEDLEGVTDHDNLPEVLLSRGSLKRTGRLSETLKADHVVKRKVSTMSLSPDVDIRLCTPKQMSPANYLTIQFQQNKPQPYFGIRKPKNFESTEEKDLRETIRRSSIQNDIVLNVMTRQKSDSDIKNRMSMNKFSLTFSTAQLGELCERFTEMNKSLDRGGSKGSSTQKDIMEILQKLAGDSVNDKLRLFCLFGYRKFEFPDNDDKMDRERILELYISKYYRIKHPLRQENAAKVRETEIERAIMKNCVLNNKLINKLLTKRSFYSHKFQAKLNEVDASLGAVQDESVTKSNFQVFYTRRRGKGRGNMRTIDGGETILDEICLDIKEFNTFYLPLLDYIFETIDDFKELETETDVEKIKKYIQSLSFTLSLHRNHPGSKARILTQQFIKAGDQNPLLLNELISNADGWLDQILKTFLSKFQSIRVEAFVTLAYLFSKQNYILAIQAHIFNDIMYDVVSTIIRCFDLKGEDYNIYYSLLGVLFYYAPSQILIDCLLERAPYSLHIEIVARWPRFLYLAFRYWEASSFNTSPIHLKRVIETLENHYLRESLSRKYLKEAITCISKRFNVNSTMFTTWRKHSTYFPE